MLLYTVKMAMLLYLLLGQVVKVIVFLDFVVRLTFKLYSVRTGFKKRQPHFKKSNVTWRPR